MKTVIYARVSSKEQEQEGFSIPAQLKLLKDYAAKNNYQIAYEFVDVETAKQAGRQSFNQMVLYLKENPSIKALLVEKTDRLYRNFRDYVTLDDLKLEIHLVKENEIISPDSRSHQKFIHGIKVLMAKNFIDNLSEETKKGLYEKAETGSYPALAPAGYFNTGEAADPKKRIIVIDPLRAPIVKTLFEMYATGRYSLAQLRDEAHKMGFRSRTGKMLCISRMEKMLKDPFYYGAFLWGGKLYPKGSHPPVISKELFDQVQTVIKNFKKAKGHKRNLAYTGILTCGDCGCAITGQIKKERYVYYHCTNYGKNCPSAKRYYREEFIDEKLTEIINDCHIDDERLALIKEGLKESHTDEKAFVDAQISLLNERYDVLKQRLDNLYTDKLDGKITQKFYDEKREAWESELREVETQRKAIDKAQGDYYDTGLKFLELAQKLRQYWGLQKDRRKRAVLAKTLLSNCTLKDGSLCPTLTSPFDLICGGLKSEEWGERRELNPQPLDPQSSALTRLSYAHRASRGKLAEIITFRFGRNN